MAKILFSFIGFAFAAFGFMLTVASCKDNVCVNYPAFCIAALGIFMVSIGVIVVLLVAIILKLENLNKPH